MKLNFQDLKKKKFRVLMEKYYENDPGNSNTLELNPPSTQISNLLFLASSHKIDSTFNL